MSAANDLPVIWSSKDIAAYLGLSDATVRRTVVTHPKFPKPLPGAVRQRRWFRDEVLEFMQDRRAA